MTGLKENSVGFEPVYRHTHRERIHLRVHTHTHRYLDNICKLNYHFLKYSTNFFFQRAFNDFKILLGRVFYEKLVLN